MTHLIHLRARSAAIDAKSGAIVPTKIFKISVDLSDVDTSPMPKRRSRVMILMD
jgi:hypothetical protein